MASHFFYAHICFFRETLLQFLYDVPIVDHSRLKESGVGKAVMYMYR